MDNKEFTPAVQPYVRTRRSAAARAAAAAAQAQSQNPGAQSVAQAAYMQQVAAEQAPAVHKHTAEQTLTAPVVYDPSNRELRAPSVKPVSFSSAGKGIAARSRGRFNLFSILLGIASGILLYILHKQNHLLSGTIVTDYSTEFTAILCVLCGGALGLIGSLILFPIYKRLSSSLPVYATLLFLPVLLFYLMPLMIKGGQFIFTLIGVAIYIIVTGIVLFLAWASLCGG